MASKDEIEINIDKIQPRTFHYLNNLVKSNLPEKKARCVASHLLFVFVCGVREASHGRLSSPHGSNPSNIYSKKKKAAPGEEGGPAKKK